MGRYYSGDIEGKFWFGVQASDDASFFGGEESEPTCLYYYFAKDDLPNIRAGLRKCREALGNHTKVLGEFFAKHEGYVDHEVAMLLNVKQEDVDGILEWYARRELGRKIEACVREQGSCAFEAEL